MDPVVDPVMLARMQFAANMSFHILFPTITVALGWFRLFFKRRSTEDSLRAPGYAGLGSKPTTWRSMT